MPATRTAAEQGAPPALDFGIGPALDPIVSLFLRAYGLQWSKAGTGKRAANCVFVDLRPMESVERQSL